AKPIWFSIALVYTIFLAVLSFINVHNLPSYGSSFDDKINHFGAYMVLTIIWVYYFKHRKTKKALLLVATGAVIYGIIIEFLQKRINPLRVFDLYDILANCVGVIFGTIIVNYILKYKVKIN
ncbi:MAG: VanZ family protein, partial [Winogradskyella sp.]|nr:VanZ family protein [Winogradskyella sp.]